jgi:hypothetical protein
MTRPQRPKRSRSGQLGTDRPRRRCRTAMWDQAAAAVPASPPEIGALMRTRSYRTRPGTPTPANRAQEPPGTCSAASGSLPAHLRASAHHAGTQSVANSAPAVVAARSARTTPDRHDGGTGPAGRARRRGNVAVEGCRARLGRRGLVRRGVPAGADILRAGAWPARDRSVRNGSRTRWSAIWSPMSPGERGPRRDRADDPRPGRPAATSRRGRVATRRMADSFRCSCRMPKSPGTDDAGSLCGAALSAGRRAERRAAGR